MRGGGASEVSGALGSERGLLEVGEPIGGAGLRKGGGAYWRGPGLREGPAFAPHSPPVAPSCPHGPQCQESGGRGYVGGGAWPGGPEMGVSPLSHAPLPQSRSSPTTVAPPPSPPWRRGHAPRPTPRPDWLWATKRGGSTSCAGTRPPPEATPSSEATPSLKSHAYCVKPRPKEATPTSEATPLKPRPLPEATPPSGAPPPKATPAPEATPP